MALLPLGRKASVRSLPMLAVVGLIGI